MRYAIVIERAGDNYSAYVPDLPGCIATAPTLTDVKRAIANAIDFHIEGLRADGEPVPEPTSEVEPQPATDADDPFVTFTEWAGEADEAAYADL